MNWIPLDTEEQLNDILEKSATRPQVIFKHSTRCSISSMVLKRLEKETVPEAIDFYFLDLIRYRPVSNKVAEILRIHHESPQVLVIKNGQCVYDDSHMGIDMGDILKEAV